MIRGKHYCRQNNWWIQDFPEDDYALLFRNRQRVYFGGHAHGHHPLDDLRDLRDVLCAALGLPLWAEPTSDSTTSHPGAPVVDKKQRNPDSISSSGGVIMPRGEHWWLQNNWRFSYILGANTARLFYARKRLNYGANELGEHPFDNLRDLRDVLCGALGLGPPDWVEEEMRRLFSGDPSRDAREREDRDFLLPVQVIWPF